MSQNLNKLDWLQLDLISGLLPKNFSDTQFYNSLPKLHCTKNTFTSKIIFKIRTLFPIQDQSLKEHVNCKPQYRDILIFKKNNSIQGIALICFSCGQDKIYYIKNKKEMIEYSTIKNYKELQKMLNTKIN